MMTRAAEEDGVRAVALATLRTSMPVVQGEAAGAERRAEEGAGAGTGLRKSHFMYRHLRSRCYMLVRVGTAVYKQGTAAVMMARWTAVHRTGQGTASP
jgi:50S ribosomal subunit-associated GTPase HflX